ncbi:polyprotein [Anopheles sinensis]|uniref:Polyprotein n=1 Tax=Anopheles sinensis TaxID=74873 RepID=A0A084WM08_ANOSI|nr:polyprotein [Anopheles sinensis]
MQRRKASAREKQYASALFRYGSWKSHLPACDARVPKRTSRPGSGVSRLPPTPNGSEKSAADASRATITA